MAGIFFPDPMLPGLCIKGDNFKAVQRDLVQVCGCLASIDDKTDVTAAACKSLSLTQELAARCQDIDVSDSSEEEMGSPHRMQHGERRQSHATAGKSQNTADSPQRRQAVQEIVDREQEYCTQLWTVVNVYQLPLQDGHYMSSRQLGILFPSPLAELCEQHCQMLHSLQDRLVHWSYAGVVGDVFARMTDSNSNLLGLYQEYVESLPGSISCLRRQLAQSRSFRAFVKTQRESNPNTELLTLLISPLQRIPKYMLQLQQVLRHTPEDHPDHFNLQASLSKLQDFVERFNHDITHTTQAIALDLQHLQAQGSSFRSSASNSSCEVMPATTSTIDSGIHSTGEDSFPPRFIRNGRPDHDGYLPKWLDHNNPYHHTNPRRASATPQRRQMQTHLNSHSQPDLTYTGYVMPNAMDPQASVPQIRSHSKMAAAATAAVDCSARQRRYKIKKRIEGPGQYAAQAVLRPTSAIDFADSREQVMMRPHSVMGPFPGDGRRVIQVHGRGKPPRSGQRLGEGGVVSQSLPIQQVARASTSPKPGIVVNGHWEVGGSGDYVDYDDEEDDTRVPSDAQSGSSHKPSSRHSQDAQETETDNSDDYSQEDLAAALSHHLNGGGGVNNNNYTVHAKDLRVGHPAQRQLQFPNGTVEYEVGGEENYEDEEEEEEEDEHVDVQLDSPESDYLPSQHQTQKPPEDMSEELKLDLTCFQDDNEGKTKLQKRALPPEPRITVSTNPVPLSMKPMGENINNSAEGPTNADRSQKEPPKEVVESLSGDKSDKVTSLPPIRPTDVFPTVHDSNSRVLHTDIDRPRRSVTPNEFSGVGRPAVMRRAATPSEYMGVTDGSNSKAGRRRKDSKNASTENLHRSIDDVSLSASKKKPFRTSLKNLFHRKK